MSDSHESTPRIPTEMYLGDGVYVKIEREFVVVFTSNGYHTTNSVYLESEVACNLRDYLIKVTA